MDDCCCRQRDSEMRWREPCVPGPAKLPGEDTRLSGAASRLCGGLRSLLPWLEARRGGSCGFSSHHADGGRDAGRSPPACSPRVMQPGSSRACRTAQGTKGS